MNRRKMLGLTAASAASLAGLLAVDGRQAANSASREIQAARGNRSGSAPAGPRGSETLVVFFSKIGKNYPDLDLTVGNTAQLARFIHERVGGDLYEIEPAEPYPAVYDQITEQAEQERDERVFPEIKGTIPDTDRYGTVFLGFPIWWYEQPMVVQTFMRARDLTTATIVPFITHEGSSFANSLDVLRQYYPQARLLEGFSERGTAVHEDPDAAQDSIRAWLQGLGF